MPQQGWNVQSLAEVPKEVIKGFTEREAFVQLFLRIALAACGT